MVCRFDFLRSRAKTFVEVKSHAPAKPIIWPIYDDAPKADKHMDVPDAEASALPKEEVDALLEANEIWGITSFFNPEGYQNKLDNFRLFRKRTTFGQVITSSKGGRPCKRCARGSTPGFGVSLCSISSCGTGSSTATTHP